MSSIGTGYDLSASQFSPDGRVFQVEYATKACENSGTIVGVRCKDGVVLAAEKIITSKLYCRHTQQRIMNVDAHIGMAFSGLVADAYQLCNIARDEAADYRVQHGMPIPPEYLASRVSQYVHAYTLYAALRPFGVTTFLASYHNGKSDLHVVEPSGVFYSYNASASGKAKANAKTELEKIKDFQGLSVRDAVCEAAKVIYTVHDEVKDKDFELEMSWISASETGERHQKVPKELFDHAVTQAKAAVADSDSDDD
ncbi:proteasome subunit alpha type-3-like [Convolutriloba macropyga]|uniref:proteasome subunit alpha type-3-like n=1 Tax=Convolutriloba macropyga TaxID=536237 RepID=UPI003F525E1E